MTQRKSCDPKLNLLSKASQKNWPLRKTSARTKHPGSQEPVRSDSKPPITPSMCREWSKLHQIDSLCWGTISLFSSEAQWALFLPRISLALLLWIVCGSQVIFEFIYLILFRAFFSKQLLAYRSFGNGKCLQIHTVLLGSVLWCALIRWLVQLTGRKRIANFTTKCTVSYWISITPWAVRFKIHVLQVVIGATHKHWNAPTRQMWEPG